MTGVRNPFVNHTLTNSAILEVCRWGGQAACVKEPRQMNGSEVLDVGRDAIWLAIQLAAPILLVGLVVGILVGMLQTVTQIQEQTLIFVPKVVAGFISLLIFLPLMGMLMSDFMRHIANRIAAL
eukprot:gene16807-16988_t